MKAVIFVEGISDENLLLQLCNKLQVDGLIKAEIELEVKSTKGWTKIDSDKGEVYRNKLIQNREGINLLIFDADSDPEIRRDEINGWKEKYGINFELFLFPNDKASGTVETLLESIVNPANRCVIECWHKYEELLSEQKIPWKNPTTPTCPSEKSKIYGYLEALVGTTHSEKERIKDKNRDFTEKNHWDLDADGIRPLKDFLIKHLG